MAILEPHAVVHERRNRPAFGGGMETNPERTRRNPGVPFPPGKQKQAVRLPGPFHEKRNNPTGFFSRFLVHFGVP